MRNPWKYGYVEETVVAEIWRLLHVKLAPNVSEAGENDDRVDQSKNLGAKLCEVERPRMRAKVLAQTLQNVDAEEVITGEHPICAI